VIIQFILNSDISLDIENYEPVADVSAVPYEVVVGGAVISIALSIVLIALLTAV